MKFVLYAIAMFYTVAGFSQQGGGAYLSEDNTCLVYNNGKDSIQLSNPDLKGFPMVNKAEVFAEVQIDGKGAKEVVVKRSVEWVYLLLGDEFGISEETDHTVYEIWNIDSKEMLFSAKCANRFSYNYNHYQLPSSNGVAHYNYDFSINDAGTISIKNSQASGFPVETNNTLEEWQKNAIPDHEEGVYTFKNGKYSKQ